MDYQTAQAQPSTEKYLDRYPAEKEARDVKNDGIRLELLHLHNMESNDEYNLGASDQ